MARVMVVSGGGTGIGLAVAQRFAGQGEQVVILGRRAAVLEDAASAIGREHPSAPPVLALPGDLSRPETVEALCQEIGQRFPAVDALVHAAGGNAILQAPPGHYDDGLAGVARRWSDNFAGNVLSAVLLTEGLRDRLRAPGGRVVLVSSIAAYRGSGAGCYGAAKAALHPYGYDLAAALGPRGITVNIVAPGYIRDTGFFSDRLPAERQAALIAETSTRRAGLPADIADAVAWLASPGAAHVTAQVIQVNGGAERGH
ncbi:SDR family NAD(P)-dependent oxidoreductase [Inquilinus limosus]|uniref:Oxidoreductase n=1 Tax=Inquilinus limosus MP06 TaxID=1398085 RepID=A0A0A0D006_9PROT|nr:SDR family oxidoreductase [Inquilinus limosus]KGM32081.1 oxidoreductase [Inquilinus limosus MP06]